MSEYERLRKSLKKTTEQIEKLEGRLANENYVRKAPPHLVQQTRDEHAASLIEKRTLEKQFIESFPIDVRLDALEKRLDTLEEMVKEIEKHGKE